MGETARSSRSTRGTASAAACILRPDAERPRRSPVEAANPYARELDDLARAVRAGGEPRLGRADAVGQARAIEALYRAARERRRRHGLNYPSLAMSRVRRALRAVAVDADLLRRRRELRLLMIGQGVSLLGSAVTLVAIPVQMYDLTGSTVAVGLVGAAQFVPILALALLGGALADAFDRRRLMVTAELGSLTVAVALTVNALLPDPQLWVLYVASALLAGFMAILRPPLDALVPRLVERRELAGRQRALRRRAQRRPASAARRSRAC